jgi:hypothetical protein
VGVRGHGGGEGLEGHEGGAGVEVMEVEKVKKRS